MDKSDLGKISKLETFSNEFVCFVKLTTTSGNVGWGQTSTYNADITAQIFHRQIAPWAIGMKLENLEELITFIEEKEHKYPGSYRCRALAGLDTAIWDLYGKFFDKPVVELLGGSTGKLRVYASSMKRDIKPQDEANRFLKLQDKYGFDAFKWRIGAENGRDIDEWPGRTEEIIKTVSESLGQNTNKLVDANSGFSAEKAIEIGKMLQDFGIDHFEEPCRYWELEETKKVRDALDIDITGGEQDWDFIVWKQMIEKNVVDICQPDVMYMGGINRTLKVAKMAENVGKSITPHSANLSLVTICTMHLLKAIKNSGKYLEFSIEGEDYYPWQKDLFLGDPFKIEDGKIQISNEPGWGVEINPNWLNNSKYQISQI